VTDIEVSPEFNTLYAGTFGRGLWKSPINCHFNNEPQEVTTQDWTTDMVLNNTIIIPPTVTLTIRNCWIHLPSEAKIVVQQGGTLILDNCTLTSACNDLWWGVEVWGDSHYPQTGTYQGKVIMQNNATIEKARKAIFCGKNIQSPFPDRAFNGGIVLADNAIFKNNLNGAMLWTYPFENQSHFTKCKFQTTEKLADGSLPEYFIALVQVKKIKIAGCNFEYLIDKRPDFRKHGRGIISFDSDYEISPIQEPYTRTTFMNLEYGIMALKIYEDQPVKVHDTYFGRNLTGIYARGIQTLKSYLNDFLVYTDIDYLSTSIFCGVYLDNCSAYTIEDNSFFEPDVSLTGSPTSIGLTINNSGEAYNEIYRNTFKNLDIGTLAQNINRSKDYQGGLKVNCNVYNKNACDISVTGSQGCTECGISISQGADYHPAGNLFSKLDPPIVPNGDINNQMALLQYWHHTQDLSSCLWYPRFTLNTSKQNAHLAWSPEYCGSKLESLTNKDLNQRIYATSSLASDSIELMIHQLTDGGNTEDLDMEITFSQPEESLELKEQLLGDSPYLSDTILIKSAEKEDVLPPVFVTEVMVANPQSAKSDKVIEAIENREIPLPEYMMAEILKGKDTVGQKEILEAELSYLQLQKEIAFNNLIFIYRDDTLTANLDSVVYMLRNHNTLQAKYQLMMSYLSTDDTVLAIGALNSIPQQFDMTNSQEQVYSHWTDLFEILIAIRRDAFVAQNLDTVEFETLNNLLQYEDFPGCIAGNILTYLGNRLISPYYLLPDNDLKAAAINSQRNGKETIEKPLFKIYPNPSKNYVFVEYDIQDIQSNSFLTIYNQEGKLKFKSSLDPKMNHLIVNTRGWPSGSYFFNFVSGNNSNQNGKIIVLD
jgi:hypothetical protein